MYQIDNSSAVMAPPIVGPPGPPGWFTNGRPAAGVEATIVHDWWTNAVQDELLTIIRAANIVPDKHRNTQVWEALQILFEPNQSGRGYLPLTGGELAGPGNLMIRGC
jgi:hypothetical protein